ncbi:MAG: hypothetical protein ACK47B_04175 [Armatimonadota bacterium]
MVDPHLQAEDEDHIAPTVTLPQGTQEYGVEFGHEERDVNFRPVVWWIAGLFITTAILCVALYFAYNLMLDNTREASQLPSPVFREKIERAGPPLVPSPDLQQGREKDPLIGPLEYRAEIVAEEQRQLTEIGFWDAERGTPIVPQQALTGVTTGQGPQTGATGAGAGALPPAFAEPMPSDSSGGLNWENRLR